MKILVIRFSSIGDIVLTTPVIRCLKKQVKACEIHYLTKKNYQSILIHNPHIDKLHLLSENEKETLHQLKRENFDLLIDLHHNLRTLRIKTFLKVRSFSFPKLNVKKFVFVYFKKNILPKVHVVDRYFETVKSLGVKNDQQGIDYFIPDKEVVIPDEWGVQSPYIAVAIGAQFKTKRLPNEKLSEILKGINQPIVLLGGKEDEENGNLVVKQLSNQQVINLCGKLTLNQSASFVEKASVLLTHDTGLMHIASAFETPIVSVWGNTVPAFGMFPYRPNEKKFSIHEVEGLSCRPCSKIGFQQCPKGHFKCMNNQNTEVIRTTLKKNLMVKNGIV